MARGDGRLSHDLLPGEKGPQDACGVFGVWAPGEEVAKLTYYGIYALQHRGQESAGIATSDGHSILVYKDMGLVSQVFDERSLASLRGHLAVGHAATRPPAAPPGRTPSPPLVATPSRPSPWPTTATSPTRRSCASWLPSAPPTASAPERARCCAATPRTRPWSPHSSPTTRTAPSRPRPWMCCPGCRAPSASSSWTSTPCMPRATRTGSAPSSSVASNAAGWSPRRRLLSTSSAPR